MKSRYNISPVLQQIPYVGATYESQRLRHQTVLTWAVPLLFALQIFLVSSRTIWDSFASNTMVLYISYVATASVLLLAAHSTFRRFDKVDRRTQLAIVLLLLFLTLYTLGLFLADYVPELSTIRRHLVATFTFSSYFLILLIASVSLPVLLRRLEWVLITGAIINALYMTYGYFQTLESQVILFPQRGIFDQPNISAMFQFAAVTVLLLGNASKQMPRPMAFALLIGLSISIVLTGSYIGLLLTVVFWSAALVRGRSIMSGGNFLLATLIVVIFTGWLLFGDTPPVEEDSGAFLNYKISVLARAVSENDLSDLFAYSAVKSRWAATVEGIREITEEPFSAKGLTQNYLEVAFFQGERFRQRALPPHNGIITAWLNTGVLAAGAYTLFIWYFSRLMWVRFREIGHKSLGVAAIISIVITVSSITGPIDFILFLLIVTLLSISSTERHKAEINKQLPGGSAQNGF